MQTAPGRRNIRVSPGPPRRDRPSKFECGLVLRPAPPTETPHALRSILVRDGSAATGAVRASARKLWKPQQSGGMRGQVPDKGACRSLVACRIRPGSSRRGRYLDSRARNAHLHARDSPAHDRQRHAGEERHAGRGRAVLGRSCREIAARSPVAFRQAPRRSGSKAVGSNRTAQGPGLRAPASSSILYQRRSLRSVVKHYRVQYVLAVVVVGFERAVR